MLRGAMLMPSTDYHMKTFTTFSQPAGWPSIGAAFQDDLAAGHRIQTGPWGGLVILGHADLMVLSRHPSADGMAPSAEDMAATPRLHELLVRALFTKSGPVHRAERAASIAAFNAVDVSAIIREAVASLPVTTSGADVRSQVIAPLVQQVWAGIVGYTPEEAARLSRAVEDMSAILSPMPDLSKASVADAAAREAISISVDVCRRGSPFADVLCQYLDAGTAAYLVAGMAFDAIETTKTGLAAALRIAAAHRGRLQPTPQCANECLRLASPAPMTMRLANAAFEFGEIEIDAGTPLAMVWAAGNHDPLAFPDPGAFDPDRAEARPLTFGMGQHACLGHAFARPLLQAMIQFILERSVLISGYEGPWNILIPADMPAMIAEC